MLSRKVLSFLVFLLRDAMHKRVLCRRAVSILLSVCLSAVWMPVTFVHSVETNKRIFKIFLPSGSFCRAMLCKRDLCYHAVSVSLCVCVCVCLSVTLVHSVKMNKHVCNFFSLSGSHTILVFFSFGTLWRYSYRNPPNRGVECKWG